MPFPGPVEINHAVFIYVDALKLMIPETSKPTTNLDIAFGGALQQAIKRGFLDIVGILVEHKAVLNS